MFRELPERKAGGRHDACEVRSQGDDGVPKRDRFSMSDTGRPVLMEEDVVTEVTPVSTALVPIARQMRWLPKIPVTRPDPTFLTQLIATAEHVPQTRSLRRASIEDAQTAYGAHPQERRSVARRTRQVI